MSKNWGYRGLTINEGIDFGVFILEQIALAAPLLFGKTVTAL